MKNPFEKEKRENPEVKELFSSLYHHISHFLLLSRIGEPGIGHLRKSNEIIDQILQISKNDSLVSVLQRLKNEIGNISVNLKPDIDLLTPINELASEANKQEKF